ncbi:MAG: GNAT family N-acetyltransferase [Anaerolineae bacterium]|nr:GNAT family N-acetyltransferase [Anaerolineae bacterium]
MTIPPAELLSWDSEFFGRRIARAKGDLLTPETMTALRAWCREQAVECLYLLVDPGDRETLALLRPPLFTLVDLRLTFERAIPADAPPVVETTARGWREEDLPALRRIASRSYIDSRFYFDGHFPAALCDRFYATWIERSCRGYADIVLVAEDDDGQPAGFVTGHLHERSGLIGLVGVAEAARGRGVGRQMVQEALAWFAERGCERVSVVTQGRNIAAQRLYQRCGFLTESLKLWYHGWFDAPESAGV